MDFLLLPGERTRVVVEVDGKQHYATEDGRASPSRYAEMVREDRKIRLAGYEVFRFGGGELQGAAGESLVREFFDQLIESTTS
jgi:very-short-patch-repair endonuclease